MNYGNEEENIDTEVVCEDSTGGINDSEFECESLENDADNEDLLACAHQTSLSPAIIVEPYENDVQEDQLISSLLQMVVVANFAAHKIFLKSTYLKFD